MFALHSSVKLKSGENFESGVFTAKITAEQDNEGFVRLDSSNEKVHVNDLLLCKTAYSSYEGHPKQLKPKVVHKSTLGGSVITHAGLGNRNGNKEFGYQEQEGVTFVVVDGQEWYVTPMQRGIGMDESRRLHERQIQAALDMNEMRYYKPLSESEFSESMVDWSIMDKAPVPDKFKQQIARRNRYTTECFTGHMNIPDPHNNENRINGKKVIGRNSLCVCGSGKKFKHCHLGEK